MTSSGWWASCRGVLAMAALLLMPGCRLLAFAGGDTDSDAPTAPPADVKTALGDRLVDTLEGPTMKVHFIDVGQGDAILVESPTGKRVLIDSGPPDHRDALFAYLDAAGIDRLDLAVNTHPHADHIGNTATLLDRMPVKRVFDSGFSHPTATYERLLDVIARKKVPFSVVRAGQRVGLGDGSSMTVLGPASPLIEKSRSDANANSVIIRLDHGDVRFLLTGDAEEETEERLLTHQREALSAMVLKVAHHGSRHATHQPFLDAVSPRLAIVSCAADNSYGHPAPETMSRLKAKGVATLVTAEVGHVIVETDGQKIALRHGRDLPASGADRRLDLNTARASDLEALPGIGESLARRIIADRTRNGRFTSVDDLTRVDGIGKGTVKRIRKQVTVR